MSNTQSPTTHSPAVGSGRTTSLLQVFPGQHALPTPETVQSLVKSKDALPLHNIQGDIFVGMKKPLELFYFFKINDPKTFKSSLRLQAARLVTSTFSLISPPSAQPLAFFNIAFSQSGLNAMGITDDLGDDVFSKGQFADAENLKDDLSEWEDVWKGTNVHGVLLVASDQQKYIDALLGELLATFGDSITELTVLEGSARPGAQAGHEHFGFLDGISNPAVQGFSQGALPGQDVVPNGIILTGREQDPALSTRPSWALDGSFLVFRKLKQLVPEFNAYLKANALQNAEGTLSNKEGADLLGARIVGRWKSGAPIDLTPVTDDPALGANPHRNNNFNYAHATVDPAKDESRCPFSAHIRKTNPRTDLSGLGGGLINHAIRAGIPYGPEVTHEEKRTGKTKLERGLAFVEYQSDIANGFQTQQKVWMNNATFPPKKTEPIGIEGLVGQAGNGADKTTFGLDPKDPARSFTIPEWVKPQGGEYFFSPSISSLFSFFAAE